MNLNTGDLAQFLVLATILGFQPGGGGGGGVTYPIALNKGGTNAVLSPSVNSLLVGTSTAMAFLATADNGVLVTSASGVPSVSTTLPSGLTIPGFLPIPTSLGANRLVVGNSTTTMIGLVTPNSSVLGSSGTGVPTWLTTLPVGITVPGYSRTTTFAGNPNGNVAGNAGDFVIDTTDGNELWYCATSGTATTATWTLSAGGSGSGVTSITAGTGLSGGTITTTGTIALAAMPADTILANATAGSATPTAVTIGSLLTFTGGVLNAVNQLANPVPLASGGTGSAITSAPPGGIFFVNSTGMGTTYLTPTTPGWALLSGQNGGSGSSSSPTWTTYALPTTVTANGLLFASSSAALGQITPVNSAVLQTSASGVPSLQTTLPNGFVTYAAIQNVTAAKLLGNPTGTAAAPSEITIGSGLTLTGSTLSATGAGVTFPITLAQGGTNTDLSTATAHSLMYTTGSGGVATVPFGTSQGTFLQISSGAAGFQYSAYSLPQTIGSGNVGGVVYASSTGALVVSAGGVSNGFVVTNSAGSPTVVSALPANSVGLSSLAQIANATLLGNASGGTANVSTISVAGALTLTGGVLTNTSPTAGGVGATGTWPISITGNAATANSSTTSTTASSVAANGVSTASIQAAAVTYAKIQNMSPATLLGNPTGSAAAPSEITLGTGLSLSGSVLSASGAGVTFPITLSQGGTNADISFATQGSLLYTDVASASVLTLVPTTGALLTTNPANGNPMWTPNITLAQMPPIPTLTLYGNSTNATAVPTAITLGTGLSLVSGVLSSSGGGGGSAYTSGSGAPTIAGTVGDRYYDTTTNGGFYQCVVSGGAGAAVWSPVSALFTIGTGGGYGGGMGYPATGTNIAGGTLVFANGTNAPTLSAVVSNSLLFGKVTASATVNNSLLFSLGSPGIKAVSTSVGNVTFSAATVVQGSYNFQFGSNLNTGASSTIGNGNFIIGDANSTQSNIPSGNNNFYATFRNGYNFFLDSTPTLPFNIDSLGNVATNLGVVENGTSYQTPTTGFSITLALTNHTTVLTPAGTLATGTIILPTPTVNQRLKVITTQTITALTVTPTGGNTIIGAPTTLAAGMSFELIFNATSGVWYPYSLPSTLNATSNPSIIMGLAASPPTLNQVGTYNNTAGTFTYTATGVQTYDGQTPVVGSGTNPVYNSVVALNGQTSSFQNGIYYVSTLGATGVNQVLTRHPLANTAALINANSRYFSVHGTIANQITYQLTLPITTLGTDNISYIYSSLSYSNSYTVGAIPIISSSGTITSSTTIPALPTKFTSFTTGTIPVNTNTSVSGTALAVFTLPTTGVIAGTWVRAIAGTGLFQIAQPAGVSIIFNTQTTTVGTGGSITANNLGCVLELIYISLNVWIVASSVGNFTGV